MPQKKKLPFVTVGFVAVNVLVYVILEILGNTENSEFMVRMGAVWPPYVKQGEYWRLFTATFMHFGFEHILNNMLVLICAGPILEKAMGHIKYLCLYLIAGVGGSTLSYVQMIARGKYEVSAGASGAIFGIIGALLWIVMIHKGRYESLTGKGLLFMIVISLYYGITSVDGTTGHTSVALQWDLFLQLFYTGNLVKQLIYRGKIPILISIKARRVYR